MPLELVTPPPSSPTAARVARAKRAYTTRHVPAFAFAQLLEADAG